MDKKIELKILHLISIKHARTAQANRELDLGGWLIDHEEVQRELDCEINELLNGIA